MTTDAKEVPEETLRAIQFMIMNCPTEDTHITISALQDVLYHIAALTRKYDALLVVNGDLARDNDTLIAERDAAYDARRNADIYARRYEEQAMSAEQTIAAARGTRLDAAGERQLRELIEERTELCKTVAFFASVIKSGESWSDTCQTMYNNTIIHLPSRT